jgi:hypothetical protein
MMLINAIPKIKNGLDSEARSCDILRHMYVKPVSVFSQRQERASAEMSAVHTPVSGLTTRIGNLGLKLCIVVYFSSPDIFNDLHMKI